MERASGAVNGDAGGRRGKNWLPLESNPELMNKYILNLGVSPAYQFHDIYGTDEALLSMVPEPVLAVLLLYPITAASEAFNESTEAARAQAAVQYREELASLLYMKQTVGNACGTIGVLHALANAPSVVSCLDTARWLSKFLAQARGQSPEAVGALLEADDDIEESHQALATEATSDVSHASNDNLHFVALVQHRGLLVELDGRRGGPVVHGRVGDEGLLRAALRVVQEYMSREPGEIRFNMTALSAGDGYD